MSIPVPLILPFPYQDYVLIGGDKSPGQAIVTAGERQAGWDEQKGGGLQGATLWPVGDPLGTFSIRFDLWLETDYFTYLQFFYKYLAAESKYIGTPGGANTNALTVEHPILHQMGLEKCVVVGRTILTKDDTGLWSQTVQFKQYRKPKPAPQPPIAVIPGAAVPNPPALTAVQKENVTMTAQLSTLAGVPK